jgi:hypothetical protein
VLALAAGYFSYENYRETSPTVPFSALPLATQQQFKAEMAEGDEEWSFYLRDQNPVQLEGAIDHYAEAYKLHPRNRAAARALSKAADALLRLAHGEAEQRREIAQTLQRRSDFYLRYDPVIDAARE